MASSLTAANPGTGLAGDYIASYLASDGGASRIFVTAAAIAAGSAAVTCPTITSIAQVTAVDGAFPDIQATVGTTAGGPWVMKLTPATTDTVNASSPMSRIYLSPNAMVVTITG